MSAEVIVGVQIALVLLWAGTNVGRELLRLKRAQSELAHWTAKITEHMRPGSEPEPAVAAEEPAPETETKPVAASSTGHRGKRGKKARKRK